MTDPFSWSLPLGRLGGVRIRLHLVLILFAAGKILFGAMVDGAATTGETAAWLGLLFVALIVHELGHAAAAIRLGLEPDDVRLWPLGNLGLPAPVPLSRASETFLVAMAGPLTSLGVALVAGVGLAFADARMVLNPFGHDGSGAPLIGGQPAPAFGTLWLIGWFGYLNWVIFLANLIPALPFDGGRMLRAVLASPTVAQPRDGLIAPWTARTFAVLLFLAGVLRLFATEGQVGGMTLILLAIFVEMMVRLESRLLEDGGFFDETVFGYDFSEGYTSLEAGTPRVRPYRESALKRWRRRRSDLRRQRREAQEAAQEQRMDEILAKLHREGRSALTDEENRFLVRVSSTIRNRPKARD